jgi:hypothetical protein
MSARRGNEEYSFATEVPEIVTERFFDLAIARVLQTMRFADTVTVRNFIGGNQSCNSKLGGRFSAYKKAGVVEGKVQGTDSNGYDYKRWTVINPDKAKEFLASRHIRPMRSEAMRFKR